MYDGLGEVAGTAQWEEGVGERGNHLLMVSHTPDKGRRIRKCKAVCWALSREPFYSINWALIIT